MKDNVWSLYYIQPYVNTSKNNCLIRSLWGGTESSTETKRNTQLCTLRQWRGACTSYTPSQHWLSSQEEMCHPVPSHRYLPRTYLLPNSQPKACLFQVSTPSTSGCIWEAVCTSSGKTVFLKPLITWADLKQKQSPNNLTTKEAVRFTWKDQDIRKDCILEDSSLSHIQGDTFRGASVTHSRKKRNQLPAVLRSQRLSVGVTWPTRCSQPTTTECS